jgi:hypothetical protein
MTFDFLSKTSRTWIILAGAAAGALIGLVTFVLIFDYVDAIEIIQIGSVSDRSATAEALIQTPAFANRVAQKVGIDPLKLTATRYGGNGDLRVRQLGSHPVIEIRASASKPETALKIVATAADLAIADDSLTITKPPIFPETGIVVEATLLSSSVSHWWQPVLIGALSGAAVGFWASRRRREMPALLAGIRQSATGEDERTAIESLPLQRSG